MKDQENRRKKRNKYAEKLAEKESISYEDAYNEMLATREATGLPFSDYLAKNLYRLDPHIRFREAEKILKTKEKRKEYAEEIGDYMETGPAEVRAEISRLNEKLGKIYRITIVTYHDYELYKDTDTVIEEKLNLFAERKKLCVRFKELYDDPCYDVHISELEDLFRRVLEINSSLITETLKNSYTEDFKFRYPEMTENEESREEISQDYLAIHLTAGFSHTEYKMYDLYRKPFSEKITYASDREMTEFVKAANDPEVRYLLDDKYSCYRKLRRFYGRDMILVKESRETYAAKRFFRRNRSFVKKPCYSRQGKGIRAVDSADYQDTKTLISALLKEDGEFVAEGMVKGHRKVSSFNPDSLNTIRIITVNTGRNIPEIDENCEAVRKGMILYAGRGIYCCASLFKTGRAGSFVDNGGAGGYFSAVNLLTGRSSEIASAENGTDVRNHPDSGEVFGSLQFENIQKAIKCVRSAALKIPAAKIIGWDLALTDRGKWVLIEGNYSPTFLGQAPAGFGIHKETQTLLNAIKNNG